MRVASKVGNLHSEFGHARLGSQVIRYVCDEGTDKRMNGRTKATLIAPFPTVGSIIMKHGAWGIALLKLTNDIVRVASSANHQASPTTTISHSTFTFRLHQNNIAYIS